jgi:hypothetical protein
VTADVSISRCREPCSRSSRGGRLDLTLDAAILGAVRQDLLFWWVELIADDAVTATSAARAVRLR